MKGGFVTWLDNVWYHYKPHILVGAFILFVVIVSVASIPHDKPSALNVTVIGPYLSDTQRQQVQTDVSNAVLGDAAKNSTIQIDNLPVTGPINSVANMNYSEKLMAETAAQTLDLVLTNSANFQSLSRTGMFADLSADLPALGLSATSPKLQKVSMGGQSRLLGVTIGSGNTAEVLSIVANSKHMSLATTCARWILSHPASFVPSGS